MTEEYLYHYKKTRKQRSVLFIRMSMVFLGYIAALYLVENYTDLSISENTRNIMIISCALTALILFAIAWWHIANPATYEAYVTCEEFSVCYPEAESLSFRVKIDDMVEVERRINHSSGGKSISRIGVRMKNSDYHEISRNYGTTINKMSEILVSINPEITFSKNW